MIFKKYLNSIAAILILVISTSIDVMGSETEAMNNLKTNICQEIPGFEASPFSTKEPYVIDERTLLKIELCFNPEDRSDFDTVNFNYHDYSFLVASDREEVSGITGCASRVFFSEAPVDISLNKNLHVNELKWFRRLDNGVLLKDRHDISSLNVTSIVISSSNGLISGYLCLDGLWYAAYSS